jgi:hypothetical protein
MTKILFEFEDRDSTLDDLDRLRFPSKSPDLSMVLKKID